MLNATTGAHVRTIGTGTEGDAVGQFDYPSGVCLGPAPGGGDQLLYVSDESNNRVQVLNATTGAHVRTIGTGVSGNAVGQFSSPAGVCLGPAPGGGGGDQLLYVAEWSNHRVQVFNAITGAHVRMIGTGTEGNAVGQFNSPVGVYCLSIPGREEPLLYVSEYNGHRVQVFNAISGTPVVA